METAPNKPAYESEHVSNNDEGTQATAHKLASPFIDFFPLAVVDVNGDIVRISRQKHVFYSITHGAGPMNDALHLHA